MNTISGLEQLQAHDQAVIKGKQEFIPREKPDQGLHNLFLRLSQDFAKMSLWIGHADDVYRTSWRADLCSTAMYTDCTWNITIKILLFKRMDWDHPNGNLNTNGHKVTHLPNSVRDGLMSGC